MQRLSILIMIVTTVAKIFGFVRETVLSAVYGTGGTASAFIFAIGLPSTIFSIIAAAFTSGFIPMYTRVSKENEEEAQGFLNNTLKTMLLISLAVSLFGMLFPETIVGIFTNLTGDNAALAANFVRITISGTFFVSIVQLLTGYLNIKESFFLAAGISIPLNVFIVIGIILSKNTNPNVMAWASLFGMIIQGVAIYGYAIKKGLKLTGHYNILDRHLKLMLKMSVPIILTSILGQLNSIVITKMVSTVDWGIAAFNFSNKLIGFVQGIFITSISMLMYPTIARHVANHDKPKVIRSFNQAISSMAVFVFPAVSAFFFLSVPIVRFVFQRGEFDATSTMLTAPIFQWLAITLIGIGFGDIITKVFYAYQDMKTPLYLAVVFVVINMGLNFALMPVFGIVGLAISSTIAQVIQTTAQYLVLRQRIRLRQQRQLLIDLIKITAAAIAMGVVVMVTNMILSSRLGNSMTLIVTIVIGVLFYGIVILLLRVSFVQALLAKYLRRTYE